MIEPPKSLTCETCRERWLRTHDSQGRYVEHTPISYTLVYVGSATQPQTARSYTELRSIIATMEEGSQFRVELVAYMLAVGHGYYTRVGDGVAVLEEVDACQGLHIAMRPAIPVESSTLQLP